MPVTTETPAPYAPASAVIEVVRRFRDRGLPSPITLEVLGRAGISDSLVPRTLQTLKILDLINDDGKPTSTLEGLRLAPGEEYKQRFVEWLNNTYADVLNFVDPATADETSLNDAFRHYSPPGQRPRMVSLFTGLYHEAGIGAEAAKSPKTRLRRTTALPNGNGMPKTAMKAAPSPAAAAVVQAVDTPAARTQPLAAPAPSISDKALEYKLVDLLKDDGVGETERNAIWALIQYLAAKTKAKPQDAAIDSAPV